MRRTTRTAALLAVPAAAALALTATACDSGGGSPSSGGSTPSRSGQTALVRSEDPKLGALVTDAKGFTLYRFDMDKPKPSVSDCNGECAITWPPAAATGSVTLKGIDKSLVGTVTRSDGSKQLTLGGWPLYRFAKDARPGDTKGQGVGGTWFASSPTGMKAGPATGGTGGGSGGGTGGHGY
ncbi:hypothetical protein [Streptomyces sp. NPDC008001]|uniref:hypothetical protein n=1 Tax=Streptomyces sp. NPDC008001 TaxID=3364804 RepID=UPI0036EA1FCF